MSTQEEITIVQGERAEFTIRLRDETGDPFNLTGFDEFSVCIPARNQNVYFDQTGGGVAGEYSLTRTLAVTGAIAYTINGSPGLNSPVAFDTDDATTMENLRTALEGEPEYETATIVPGPLSSITLTTLPSTPPVLVVQEGVNVWTYTAVTESVPIGSIISIDGDPLLGRFLCQVESQDTSLLDVGSRQSIFLEINKTTDPGPRRIILDEVLIVEAFCEPPETVTS